MIKIKQNIILVKIKYILYQYRKSITYAKNETVIA